MDFDTAKENIQPLRHGRRADRLELALGNEKEILDQERRQHEELIDAAKDSDDPLGAWYEYICWIEQSYLKSGSESGLDEAVSRCLSLFENDPRYKQDRRLIKLFIQYIDSQENPQELYNQLYMSGIGTMVADLYIAWSHYYDAVDDFKQAEVIFRKGKDAGAQPYEELAQAHQNFSISMSQRIIYNDEESKKKFQASLEEKRGALTRLRAHKKKNVGSIRTGFSVLNENPGRYEASGESSKSQIPVVIHEDDGNQPASTSISIIKRNIVDPTKKKNENFLEPGPWSKVKLKTGIVNGPLKPSFEIMEDENTLPPIKYQNKLYELGAQLPKDFISRNKPQKSSDEYLMIVHEPIAPRSIPCYEKFSIYPNENTEISPEELRGFRWFVKNGINAPVVEKYSDLLINNYECPPRLFPGYVKENIKEPEIKYETELESYVIEHIQLPIKRMYEGKYEIKSMEELLAEKFNRGLIKLLDCSDFDEDLSVADMELTMVHEGRQSIYPLSRKSFVPRKSILRKSIMPKTPVSDDEEVQEKTKTVRFEDIKEIQCNEIKEKIKSENDEISSPQKDDRLSLKRKLETPDKVVEAKSRFVAETPPPTAKAIEVAEEVFKSPLPPPVQETRKSIRGFEILEDDETFCSTQQFNLFVKASSISTPNNMKKIVPRLLPLQPIPMHDSPEKSPPQESKINSENEESPVLEAAQPQQQQTPAPKQLSTIMEVTETTHSTKSSYENETTSKTPMSSRKKDAEKSFNPFQIHRIPEEQTETTMAKSIKLPRACDLGELSTHGTSQKFTEIINIDSEVISPTQDIKTPAAKELSVIHMPVFDISEVVVPPLEDTNIQIPPLEYSDIEIPATQDVLGTSHVEIPATQDVLGTSHVEIPAMQEQAYETQQIEGDKSVEEVKSVEEISKPQQFQFAIYEDSFAALPSSQAAETHLIKQSDESKIFHVSCKENLEYLKPALNRVASDELLDLCGKSPIPKITNESVKKNENSDLLKFSACASIEGSFRALELNPPTEQPKSASPTMQIFEEDLNTERFKFPLTGEKNSTLLFDVFQKKSNEKFEPLNLSLEMNEQELNAIKNAEAVFKVPLLPPPKPQTSATSVSAPKEKPYVHNTTPFTIFEDTIQKEAPQASQTSKKSMVGEEMDDEDDMSKTIFYNNYEKEELCDPGEISDDQETWEDQAMCSFIANDVNRYEYTIIQEESTEISIKLRNAIIDSKGDPFSHTLRNVIMEQVNFEKYLEEHVPQCKMLKNIPKLKSGIVLEVNNEEFKVGKLIAKGSFGSIYIVEKLNGKEICAAKQEKPANLWEYFICMELMDRLKSNDLEHMLPAFMQINYAIIGNNASVFITEYSHFGTIIDVCNKIKKVTGRHMDEYIGMVLTTQLLSIIDFLHSCHIIHADIKPDNFLLMTKVELGSKVPALQLIDFGTAIDMEVYSKEDEFNYVVKTENFTCCEMLENKPWTYQTDLFGLAGTAHVMIFGKYMQVEKKIGKWDIISRYPRYFQKDLWTVFFNTLLNVPDSFSMPNLQELKEMLLHAIEMRAKYVSEKLSEFNNALLS